jgi:hypothetical protein
MLAAAAAATAAATVAAAIKSIFQAAVWQMMRQPTAAASLESMSAWLHIPAAAPATMVWQPTLQP